MRVNHIAVNCIDLELVKQFFVKYFNAQVGAEYCNPKTGLHTWMLLFPAGSAKLELMSWPDTTFLEYNIEYMKHRQGMTHISMSVGSPDAVNILTQRLESNGYQRLSGPRITGNGYYESCILGPENLEIEITI